ncbi:MAG: hypothetical protein EOP68_13690 [Sphingomonas sp.]|nr:MAG: hypothetical protein EOP68_13690 [Sphingomonas sp.]
MEAAIGVIAPAAVTGVATRCRAALPANAYLARNGATLVARLRPAASAALPAARQAFGRVAGIPLPASLDDGTVVGLIEAAVTEELVSHIKPAECGAIDRVLAQADPLPPRNLAALIAGLAELGVAGKDAPFRICAPALAR